ncbi:hypothetical protein LFYK43_00730 [Ligilactobacillus salitolerans]|uniref:HTH araC/xylS-type domain-containing protein n=1 Tax=Ligilactobacillus salitolerans TaxID=1808352 RepID=A0A401IQ29_9LACO|nr:AraC family transcriptional regulator [Ligilactobacillus salitolerans]GBG93614.1 hypothetical protein LFYK43_00730 [Ligilactobacillus salitolerans]
MPQKDRYKDRIVNIDFTTDGCLKDLPCENNYTLALITSGFFTGTLNGIVFKCKAPCLLCLTKQDTLKIQQEQEVVVPIIQFDQEFLATLRVSEQRYLVSQKPSLKAGMQLFRRDGRVEMQGIYQLSPQIYPKVLRDFFVAGSEVLVQSDEFWVCRIKENLIETLFAVFELIKATADTPINKTLSYIAANYAQKITLSELTDCSFLNRDSLNKEFRERFGCTAMGYLTRYRIKIAKELLTHTGLSLNEIAYATGFAYDTYFIRQFKKCEQQNPTAYREQSRKLAAYQ